MDFKANPDIDPAIWEHYYEAAIATRKPEIRLQRIVEAQALILRRAEALEEARLPMLSVRRWTMRQSSCKGCIGSGSS
jgi:hypothetical protein